MPDVPSSSPVDPPLRFGRFEISPAERVLRVDGEPATLGARAFDLLLALAQRRQRLVTKQELLDLVWPGVVVEEHNIAAQISTLRKWLGASAIATVPGRGYRFTALPADDGPAVAAQEPVPSAQAETASPGFAQSQLPRELTPLLGRDQDLSALAALVQRHRLVTLVGAGGMGKSLLARHLLSGRGGDYAHGVCWIELASVSDPAALPLRIARALGVHPGSGEPLAGLCAAVSSLTLLVALDNAEHLLAAVADTAAALLEAAPGLRLIVTSQAPLRLAAERVYRVGPLAVPQGPLPTGLAMTFGAVALFVERARGADARFVLSDASAPAAIELCRQLDGLPLAIELAAARAPLLGVTQLAASMQDRLHVLTHNRDAAAPARQQTLRAALEWSHGWLDERERTVFRRLGVMADSASLVFVQQVVADEPGPLDGWAVLDALGVLVDRSLVAVLADDDGEPREPRYRLLESPRLYALEQLHAAGEDAALRRRHARALAAAFDAAWDERFSGRIGVQRWASGIMSDASNARDALAWAATADEPDTAVAIAATLFQALPRVSHGERMALGELCESLAEHVAAPHLKLRALQVGARPFNHPRHQRSLELAAQAVALARALDAGALDRWPLYHALSRWIMAASVVAHPAVDRLRAASAELAALEDPRWPAHRRARGIEALRLARLPIGGPDQATDQLSLTHRWIALLDAEGDETAPCMGSLVDAEIECGHLQVAIELGERVIAQLAGSRDEWSRSLVQSNLAIAYLMQDDTRRARAQMQAVWPLVERWSMHAQAADLPPLLAVLEGRPCTAARLAGYSDAACAARDLIRHPLEVVARERSHALARAALGDALFERLYAEGGQLRDEQIGALAFENDDSVSVLLPRRS